MLFCSVVDFTPVENNVVETVKLWGKQWYMSLEVSATAAPSSGKASAVTFEDSSGNEFGGVFIKSGPKMHFVYRINSARSTEEMNINLNTFYKVEFMQTLLVNKV